MPTALNSHPISCRCGQLRGAVTATRPSNRCVCYCTDCQAFARHLKADAVLDAQGGTGVVHVPPAHVQFTQGAEHLACLRLTQHGMLRWYAACCNSPIANTPADWRFAFVGLVDSSLGGDEGALAASFGPVNMQVEVQNALGRPKPRAFGMVQGIAKMLLIVGRSLLGRGYRKSPFFAAPNGTPVARPTVLSAEQLRAAKQAPKTA